MCLLVDEKSLLSSQTRVKRTTLVVLTKSNTAELCEIARLAVPSTTLERGSSATHTGKLVAKSLLQCAGINRHEAENERVSRERSAS